MASLFNTTSNISLYTVPFAWALCLAPRVYATQLYEKASSRQFDNREPRSFTKMVMENQSIDSATKGRIIRAESAQQNGFENIGFFATAVVAGNLARLDTTWLNTLSVGYVISRILYNLIYLNNTTAGLATTRTVTYISGIGMIWTIFIMAGNKLRSSPWEI
ncbi:hypothetical protein EPUS_04330 [Endocarpon pusillum Z07020]|uniref:Uncharacterized protein n=1 Tax=Endocarpon pusillum (strain Z07020 / HMAS-L-300199) TaxID=1263415 RepID=U1GUW3_ENDPU|nr:uncharacterized protein EPUS_04330 [Endocarpon pusillum Z07020]ERF76253.1 hypothetical protein EPUS_04330 [Endocarpon pusillum Z07020]